MVRDMANHRLALWALNCIVLCFVGVPTFALAETKEGKIHFKRDDPTGNFFPHGLAVEVGKRMSVTCKLWYSENSHGVTFRVDYANKINRELFGVAYYGLFDDRGKLVACHEMDIGGIPPGKESSFTSVPFILTEAELAQISSYQIAYYEDEQRIDQPLANTDFKLNLKGDPPKRQITLSPGEENAFYLKDADDNIKHLGEGDRIEVVLRIAKSSAIYAGLWLRKQGAEKSQPFLRNKTNNAVLLVNQLAFFDKDGRLIAAGGRTRELGAGFAGEAYSNLLVPEADIMRIAQFQIVLKDRRIDAK